MGIKIQSIVLKIFTKYVLFLVIFFISSQAIAQKLNSKWYKTTSLSNSTANIRIQDAVSKAGYLKFKLTIENTSQKHIFYDPTQFAIRVGDSLYYSKGKSINLSPGTSYSDVLDFRRKNLMVDSFYLEMSGLKTESNQLRSIQIKDLDIPEKDELADSQIYINVSTLKRLNKMTFIQFAVEYKGNAIIRCEPGKTRLKVPSGKVLSPQKVNPDVFILDPQSSEKEFSLYYTFSNQIANLKSDPLVIEWSEMFTIIKTDTVFQDSLKIMLDPVVTKTENR